MNTCKNCDKSTKNPKFCNKSCAAIYNNKRFPKRRRKPYYCKHCGVRVAYRRTTCNNCNPSHVNWNKITIADIRALNLNRPYTRITTHSRNIYLKSYRPNQCLKCGYDRHFNVCHIKPIHTFDDSTVISVVNDLDNLIALCPTHHWELDNGFLNVKELFNQELFLKRL